MLDFSYVIYGISSQFQKDGCDQKKYNSDVCIFCPDNALGNILFNRAAKETAISAFILC
jgi:hypothetical protein